MPQYINPPIVERVASVWAPMPPEIYEGRFDVWRQIVQQELPVYEPVKEWLINVREKDGIPLYDTMQPELRITPRFSKKPSAEGFDWSIRCPTGQFTMNMHSKPGDHRGYSMLRTAATRWISQWTNHFSVRQPDRILLHYVNRLDATTVPSFIGANGTLALNRLITLFQIPGDHKSWIPPCDCKATVLLNGREEATLGIHLLDEPGRQGLRLDFYVHAKLTPEENSAEHIVALIDWAHERIIERFEVVFTPEAKQSFQPEDARQRS